MADKKVTKEMNNAPFMNVVLLDRHTHQGVAYKKGDTITIRRRQLEKLQEWGKVK